MTLRYFLNLLKGFVFYMLLFAMCRLVFLLYFASCTKHNAVELGGGGCDTTNVSYSKQVVSILENNCYQCHQSGHGG